MLADPMLSSLLVARAEKIKALYIRGELHDKFRDLLRKRDFVEFGLQFLRNSEMRRFYSGLCEESF